MRILSILAPMEEASSARISAILDMLETLYGRTRLIPRFDPMEELVSCILSQSSSDSSSFPAFTRLMETFGDWETMARVPQEAIAQTIRQAGLANQKSKAIQACLREIHARNGAFALDNLRDLTLKEARDWLQSLPGVGPKTASIVLCFSFGMAAIPVDTHVYRVATRIGIVDPRTGEARSHDLLLDLVRPEDAFRFHTLLIQHGRHLCSARNPRCGACPIRTVCQFGGSTNGEPPKPGRKRKARPARTNK